MDFIRPGIVDWKRVKTLDKMSKMAAKRLQEVLGNCNYAVELGKKLNFSLVGIAGATKLIMDVVLKFISWHFTQKKEYIVYSDNETTRNMI